jgi:hypothetical protein
VLLKKEKEMNMAETKSVYEVLSKINVNDKTETKNGLTYLSWAWAWGVIKENFPLANYTIYENKDGWNYFTDGRTAWVKTGVNVDGLEHIEYLPVMDFKNKSVPLEVLTSVDVNKAIQRSLTKAVARLGLGLYIYAGSDLPEDNTTESVKQPSISGGKDFKINQVAQGVAGDPNQKARITTIEQLREVFAQLSPEKREIAQKYMLKNGALKFDDLTETIARTLLLNLQAGLGK